MWVGQRGQEARTLRFIGNKVLEGRALDFKLLQVGSKDKEVVHSMTMPTDEGWHSVQRPMNGTIWEDCS